MSREKYRFKRKPYAHQVAALRKLLRQKWGGALLMSPRTGKTKVAIDWTAILHQKGYVTRVLVICPVSVMDVWVDEIKKNCPFRARIVVWDRKARKEITLPPVTLQRLCFVIVNYDAFSAPGAKTASGRRSRSRGGRFGVFRQLTRWDPHVVILDESHRIKSPRAKKSSMVWKFVAAPYRLIMTGTAVTKKKRIADLWSQWQFLNPQSPLVRNMTYGDFKDEYGVWTKRNGYPQWLRERNKNKLHALLHTESFAVERDECFDLPKRTDQIIPVPLTGQSAIIYDELAETMVAQLQNGEITTAQLAIVLRLRLAQLTGGIAKTMPSEQHPEGRFVRVGRDKLEVIEQRLTDLFEEDEKVVIGARFRYDIAAIVRIVKKLKCPAYELHGGIGRAQRTENIAKFRQCDEPAAFIMQPSAGSLGIDLSTVSIFIWFSLPGGNYVDFTQAEDRVALSERPTFFEYLEVPNSVDTLLRESLTEDGDVVKTVMRSPERLLRNFKP
jgi:SNF2 family DNA or RNA helicase